VTNTAIRFLVALLGARCHYAVPLLLEQQGILERFFTDITSQDWPSKAVSHLPLPSQLQAPARRLCDRHVPGIDRRRIVSFPIFGLSRAVRHAFRKTPGDVLQGYAADNASFCRHVCRSDWGNSNAVFGFNGAALEIFEQSRRRGFLNILEQTIAPYAIVEPMLAQERTIWPGWDFEATRTEQWTPIADREMREWELSDTVICGSQFVADGIQMLVNPKCRLEVVSYGIDLSSAGTQKHFDGNRPLRVLFLGTVELRKGIQYLMEVAEAWRGAPVQFRTVGPVRVEEQATQRMRKSMEVVGSVPRSGLLQHLDWADVFVLPTLAEGSALVVYEALAAGLPVITTANAGSVVQDGVEGFLVPLRDSNAIRIKLEEYLNRPSLISIHSERALSRASEFTVAKYGERLAAALGRISRSMRIDQSTPSGKQ
jgi:glycosyltransferase involved in cell wall biosynthesis